MAAIYGWKKVSTLNPDLIRKLLSFTPLSKMEVIVDPLLETLKDFAAEKGHQTIRQVADDPEFTNIVVTMAEGFLTHPEIFTGPSKEEADSGSSLVDHNAPFKCPHCAEMFTINTIKRLQINQNGVSHISA
jgi:hypothetical protein